MSIPKKYKKQLGYTQGYMPENMSHKRQCNICDCSAGLGLAGHGRCFLNGKWWLKKCPMFIKERS